MAKTLDAAGVKRLIQEIKGANKNLNAAIPISTENTPESMAQNVKNIADYVEKAKAAGIDTTKSFRLTLEIDGYPVEGSYDIQYSYACGLQITDDGYALLYNIDVTTGEVFTPYEIVTAHSIQKVTSSMLDEGARKPIILTPSTTEVDEATYQKLLSDDVDVVFKDIYNTSEMALKEIDSDKNIRMSFNAVVCAENIIGEGVEIMIIIQYNVKIFSASPHSVVTKGPVSLEIEPKQYVTKSTLSPVLQEIDLTGTDAERKAKLDKFEADWKTSTGADYLTGARFVGKFGITDDVERNVTGIMTYSAGDTATEKNDNCFYGICNGYSFSEQKSQIAVKVSCTDGSLTITPLFSHLEAITIRTGNNPDDKAANVAAIKAYVDNLTALGVDTTKGYMIPVTASGRNGFLSTRSGNYPYAGYAAADSSVTDFYNILILGTGEYHDLKIQPEASGNLHTKSKQIVPAINEVNANAVHSDKLVPTLEAITIYTDNTPEHMQANLDNIAAYKTNLETLGIDTTGSFTIPIYKNDNKYPGTLVKVNGLDRYTGWFNLDNRFYPIVVAADGTYVETLTLTTDGSYSSLTTTSKHIVGAINEINALAKGYSTIFTPIELTTETAQNKTAIDARVAAFTAQGISLTNGCCIPVTYKGVYAGNISLINGDWYGLLVKNTNNPADNINIKLSADGTITEGNSAQ